MHARTHVRTHARKHACTHARTHTRGEEGGREGGREGEREGERERPDLNEGHVHAVHVGPLLPVHLDADKAGVEQRPNLLALKGLPLHDVAPVAGGVADREEDQLVLAASLLKCLLTPRIPGGGRGMEGREREGDRERERERGEGGGEGGREREGEREGGGRERGERERRAQGPSHQWTGLEACCCRYGDFSAASLLRDFCSGSGLGGFDVSVAMAVESKWKWREGERLWANVGTTGL